MNVAKRLLPGLAGMVLALGVAADPGDVPALSDPHLSIAPRPASDTGRVVKAVQPAHRFDRPEPGEDLAAGAASLTGPAGKDAFSQPSANMQPAGRADFDLGNVLFRKIWIAAPSSIANSDGLGPLYNARSCEACHRRDGRGALPEDDRIRQPGLVLRLARAGGAIPFAIPGYHPTRPDPVLGRQLQDIATPGLTAEGTLSVRYSPVTVRLGDGSTVDLRKPAYAIADRAVSSGDAGLLLSARLAPPMIGLGLVEAIPSADILAHADPLDADNDGISGRANIVGSAEFGQPMLGRFGWKAGQPTIRAQTAAALAADMGLSNPLHPAPWGDCTAQQPACRHAPHGQQPGSNDGLELDGTGLDLLTFYARNLAVPVRRGAGRPEVLAGKRIFTQSGCAACHVPKFRTARLADRPEHSDQLIRPYSDFLLHDMGDGLADAYPEGLAEGREWRTAPLWGIGLTGVVGGRASYLHDGRARTLLEAILWHGGEAAESRDRVIALPALERRRLLDFLESL